MDKAIYIDSSAAKNALSELEMISNNLANVATIGFRADDQVFKSVPVTENKDETRVYSTISKAYTNFDPGPITTTGRDLDVAISGAGFITLQNKSGDEAYTRAGDLQVKNGFLSSRSGDLVKGLKGVIKIPEQAMRVVIGADGSVSTSAPGQVGLVTIDYLKLTNPPIDQIHKGKDGLFYLGEGQTAKHDPNVRLLSGSIEGSNVSPVKSLIQLIELSRHFEFHSNLIKSFSDGAAKANQLLNVTR